MDSPDKAGCELRGFPDSINLRFEGGIPNFMNGIPDFMDNFNTF